MPNELARELCSEKKRVDATDFQWFSHIERIDNSRNVKRNLESSIYGKGILSLKYMEKES